MKKYILIGILSMIIYSCDGNKSTAGVNGTLKDYNGLDGCTWIIELDNGEKLQPVNLLELNIGLTDGKKVTVTYDEVKDMSGICMTGIMVSVKTIEER